MKAFAGAAGGSAALLVPLLLMVANDQPPSPPAAAVQLDVDLTNRLGSFGGEPHHVLVLAPSPFSGPARASDRRGLNRAVVTPIDRDLCHDIPPRDLRLPGPVVENCLEVSGLHAGSAATAELRSTPSPQDVALTLELQARHHFLWPTLAATIGLVASVVLAIFKRVRPVWSRAAKRTALGEKVAGGNEWLAASALQLDDDTQVAILQKVSDHGASTDAHYREALGHVLAAATADVRGDHPLRLRAARAISDSADGPGDVWDFFSVDGQPITHPLAVMAAGLGRLQGALHRVATLLETVRGDQRIIDRTSLLAKLERLRRQLDGADEWDEVGRLNRALDAVELEILRSGVVAEADALHPGLSFDRAQATPSSGTAAGLGPVQIKRLVDVTTTVVAAIATLMALAGVLAATWGADPDFGTASDYFEVVVAAFGAGSAGSLTALVADRLA